MERIGYILTLDKKNLFYNGYNSSIIEYAEILSSDSTQREKKG